MQYKEHSYCAYFFYQCTIMQVRNRYYIISAYLVPAVKVCTHFSGTAQIFAYKVLLRRYLHNEGKQVRTKTLQVGGNIMRLWNR